MFAVNIGMSCEERTCAAPVQHTTEKPLLVWIQSQFLADFTQYLTRLALERQHIAQAHGGVITAQHELINSSRVILSLYYWQTTKKASRCQLV